MDNNYNPNTESNNNPPIDSLYSYSYANKEDQKKANGASEASEAKEANETNETNETNEARQTYSAFYEGPGKPGDMPKPKKKGGFGKTLGKCAAIALVLGLVSGTVFYGTGYIFDYATGKDIAQTSLQGKGSGAAAGGGKVTTTSTGTQAVVSDVSQVVDNVMPSIVSITNMSVQEYHSFFGQTFSQETPSAGSGIIVAQTDKELYIATNNHVVSGADTLSVSFVNDKTVAAEVKGTDASTDLAVISVKKSDIPEDTLNQIKVATLGKSDSLQVGEPAIAIGNALGYGQSVTTGVVSALNREVTLSDPQGGSITNSLIQTDAAINPGNSGGALLNIKGEVVGINSAKYTDTKVEGMGYAIPMSTAEPIINDLITKEVVEESKAAYLGVAGVDVTDEVGDQFNMPKGLYVTQVMEGSAAEQAGIRQGDIITAFDGRAITSMDSLRERLQYYSAGSTVEIARKTSQDGKWVESTVTVTLGKKN